MFSSTEQIGLRRWRVLLAIIAVVVIVSVGEPLWFRATHKAPLGRTASDVTRSLLLAFPPGTPADSAAGWLRRHGIECCSVVGDSLFGTERDVAGEIVRTDIQIRAILDTKGRIVSWSSKPLYTGP